MKRIFYQAYVRNSDYAIETYRKAFHATVLNQAKTSEGVNIHTELNIYGQVLALSEIPTGERITVPGNTMQFYLQFDTSEKDLLTNAYETLKTDATIQHPLGACFYSECMVDITDQFGVRWCLFI